VILLAEEVIAYLLILTTSEGTENLLKNLRAMPEVTEAFVIYGDWDLIVRVKVGSLPELTKFVMELRKNKSIRKTSTLIALMED
jgi:DNA-binding Lrp family transcriptional regulator